MSGAENGAERERSGKRSGAGGIWGERERSGERVLKNELSGSGAQSGCHKNRLER